MIVNVTWTFGNFDVTAETDIPTTEPVTPLTAAMLRKGFLQLLQRSPATAAEKALAGYEKRPKGFQRNSIGFTAERAAELLEAFGTDVEVEDGVKLAFEITNVIEHVVEEGAATKESTELWNMVKGMDEEEQANALANLGLDDTSDETAGILACKKVLQKAKADAAAAAKAKLSVKKS